MEFVDSTLKVQRASVGMKQAAGVEMGVNAMAMMAGTTSTDLEATRVLQLLNMVTPEELMDNEEYEGMSSKYSLCNRDAYMFAPQKSVKTSAKNARNTASSSI